MIQVNVGSSWALVTCDSKTAEALDLFFARYVNGYKFSPLYKRRLWDGKTHFFDITKRRLPSGLVPELVEYLGQGRVSITGQPERNVFASSDVINCLEVSKLRDYQIRPVVEAIAQTRGILKLATNAGKTIIAAAIIQKIGGSALYCIHTKELMYQTQSVLQKELGQEVGLIGDGHKNLDTKIVIAMIQSASRLTGKEKKKLLNRDVLIVDECFHGSSKTYSKLARACGAKFKIGLSGTPFNADEERNTRLRGCFGPVLDEIKNEELIEKGWSARPTIKVREYHHDRNNWSWQAATKFLVVENKDYNAIIMSCAKERVDSGSRVLIISDWVRHGAILYEIGRQLDMPISYIHGSLPSYIRNKAVDELRNGKLGCLIGSRILEEGLDIPQVNTLILASMGKSPVQLLQRIGRALRQKEGINTVEILDFFHRGNKYLNRHSKKRLGYYVEEGFDIKHVW
jgi:superfamily II DNA or RNA helicase